MNHGGAKSAAKCAAPVTTGRIEVARTARFCQVGRLSAGTSQIWFACHGYRQLAERFAGRFAAACTEGAVVVAPEALSRFYVDQAPGVHGKESRVGASWMTHSGREAEIRDYVAYLDALAGRILAAAGPVPAAAPETAGTPPAGGRGAARPKVVALGFSQGGHTAARWAAYGSTAVDELVLWGSHLPAERGVAGRLAGLGVTSVFGDGDPAASAAAGREDERRLAAAGGALTRLSFRGGHQIDAGVVLALARAFSGGSFPLGGASPQTGAGRAPGSAQNSPTKAISGSST